MTAKTSVSLTKNQEAFARELVERGKYPSLSAVLQHGLELLRQEREVDEAELAALRALLKTRRRGEFVEVTKGRERTARIIRAKKGGLMPFRVERSIETDKDLVAMAFSSSKPEAYAAGGVGELSTSS